MYKQTIFPLEEKNIWHNLLAKSKYFSFWKQRGNVLLNVLGHRTVDAFRFLFITLFLHHWGTIVRIRDYRKLGEMIGVRWGFRARRWTPQSPEALSLVLPAGTKAGVRGWWGCSKWNVPQVMLIKEARGPGRSGGLLLMVERQRLVKSGIVCWPGKDKNTKGTEMDLNTGTYQYAFYTTKCCI